MLLSSMASPARLELSVVDYQFPDPSGGPGADLGGRDWDANWLLVEGTVTAADGGSWTFRQPCLTTWEAAALAEWLETAAAKQDVADLTFVEPNLGFRATVEGRHLVILLRLSHESRRPGAEGAYELVLDLAPDLVRAAAREWRHEIEDWPAR